MEGLGEKEGERAGTKHGRKYDCDKIKRKGDKKRGKGKGMEGGNGGREKGCKGCKGRERKKWGRDEGRKEV